MTLDDNAKDLHAQQLIEEMMLFLDDKDEVDGQLPEHDEVKNPLSCAIKSIINQFPHKLKQLEDDSRFSPTAEPNQIEGTCRDKDPYMLEVNRLIFASPAGHPPEGSLEYYQAAENYALFGSEFLDFPTSGKFLSSFPTLPPFMPKAQSSPGFGVHIGKSTKQQMITSAPQQQILVNQTNFCSYPLLQVQNLMQPLIYANPYLMAQYFNTFVKETQINTSLLQQQQFLGGGAYERLLYAQMLQQQIQTNQAALMSACFASKHDALKIEASSDPAVDGSAASEK